MNPAARWRRKLVGDGNPPGLAASEEPPADAAGRETDWVSDHSPETRDMRPALGTRGGPAPWTRAKEGAEVALARRDWGDARWSFLFKARDTRYASAEPAPGEVATANRSMRRAPMPGIQGPFIKGPVWEWEVPLYFWVGGLASGSAFVALACDLAGDPRSAATARKVALGVVATAPPLLISDLGRPERFLNMLRVFKPRSPMNMGAWCLVMFSSSAAGAVGADLLRRPRAARALGALTSVLGGYLGSYAGVLLATTAVPVWARSRLLLGPIFVSTATATGAAATRLVLVARGLPEGHPTRRALGTVETGAILSELSLSALNERRLGQRAAALHARRPARLFRVAQTAVVLGLSSRVFARRIGPRAHDLGSMLYLAGGLAFRYAWLESGKESAADHEAVAAMGRGHLTQNDAHEHQPRVESSERRPLPMPGVRRLWGEALRRASLAAEQLLG